MKIGLFTVGYMRFPLEIYKLQKRYRP